MTDDRNQLLRTILWRRLDVEGMDACALARSGSGYVVSGTAVYQDRLGPAKLDYEVSCNADWSSRSARVRGWLGDTRKDLMLSRGPGDAWSLDGRELGGLDGLPDVDLGFTPATNTTAINRLDLEIGGEAATTAVWLDVEDWGFKPLRQVYRRLSENEFAYSSPSHDYAANLVTDDFGLVRSYPHLWTAVAEVRASAG